ncbi:YncE family protein [Corynebacterium uterequi]|uniref:hypothetical protein n=1 Tax=Corynebacterium uterequi TaxID=1072256 RepID=UPI0011876E6D|nr:hypothetical protein [Corynebacterium uterequi]
MTPRNQTLSVLVLAAGLMMSSCQDSAPAALVTGGEEEALGNAVPVASPPAENNVGETIIDGEVSEVVTTGSLLGARIGDELIVGSIADFRGGDARRLDIAGCADVTGAPSGIVVACGDHVRIVDAAGDRRVDVNAPATTAVLTTDGALVTASDSEHVVQVYDGAELAEEFDVAGATHELLAVPVSGSDDAVLRINRDNTTIQDVRVAEARQGGTLRVGLGVGTAAAGDNDLAVVSDTRGSQLAIYTADEVVRLHQTLPVDESPFAVAYDGELAWIASTATNTATGYDIAGGVPVEKRRVPTPANVRAMVFVDGHLVVGGTDGLTLLS